MIDATASITRRRFLHTALFSAIGISVCAAAKRPPRMLLRSSWQVVNIGDIAHTPGVLALLEKHLPEVEVRLWPTSVDNGVKEMLRARFPNLVIIKGAESLKSAFDECDFLLHGSGPSLVAEKDVIRWSRDTGKPYGIYGITLSAQGSIPVLNAAKFVFFRDSVSLEFARKNGCTCPVMAFGPDGAFAADLANDAKAEAFLKQHALVNGKFLCCIARLRNTPKWLMPGKHAAVDEAKLARNEAMKEHDCRPLREAITAVVRQTDLKVLLCPEDETQMTVNKEMLYDQLAEDVKAKVVWRETFWLTDEALSTYRRSAGLFGHEMHSPIMCVGNGIPAIVCRWAEQTSKGIMWRDIGLSDWLFDFDDEADVKRLVPAVLAFAKDPVAARAKTAKARVLVEQRQRETMAELKRNLSV